MYPSGILNRFTTENVAMAVNEYSGFPVFQGKNSDERLI